MSDPARVLVVVENDPDFLILIRLHLGEDPRIVITGEADSADEAVEMVREAGPGLVILDHYLSGEVKGLETAPRIREEAPDASILLLSSDDLSTEARAEPTIDAFVWKGEIERLLPAAQRLLGLAPLSA